MSLLFEKNNDANWWPLHQDSSCSEQLIAGQSLLDLQTANAAGIQDATQYDSAWITPADWAALAAAPQPAVLKSEQGDILAWIGSPSGTEVTASAESFLLNYSWDFITLNERIVSTLDSDNIQGDVSPAAHIDGHIHVGKGTKILPGVVIEGNIIIGENCKIGPNCYLRGSTTIGNNCHIGQAVEIKNSVIGNGSSAGHLSYVGDTIIGDKVNLGAGTITSNLRHDGTNHKSILNGKIHDTGRRKFGAIIGNGTHTGILTAIYPGRKLGPNSTTLPNGTVEKDIIS